ncbi:33 kDa inner dynein arm light chain, axonemal isoform X3 [Vespa velutina]|uniref:33 kDa inner dynein arm light chain, axonemal isoform X3 n=1 Tax=Vespa velutina TaxID=202808 RepID=UPI001FB22E0B|nr:33 kDa inner dynein arm light chain, axonemal isoform X3 [Vespa velutina]
MGRRWTNMDTVSSTPATRLDVINLQEQLDMKLQQRQARETGICPVRRELYTQCFDELIRQVTINCAERGLLLLRVRDEIKMTLAAYQTLYQSSIAFGMRKALQAEQGKEDLVAIADELRQQKTELENALTELRHKFDLAEKRSAELKEAEEKKYTEEIQFLKKTNLQLKVIEYLILHILYIYYIMLSFLDSIGRYYSAKKINNNYTKNKSFFICYNQCNMI